jgi:hypothetical protein
MELVLARLPRKPPKLQLITLRFVYVEDDHTVNKSGGTNHVAAGLCIGLDADGVWIDPELAPLAI